MSYKLSKEEEYLVLCLKEGMKVGVCKIPIITVDFLYEQNKNNQQYTNEGRIEYRSCNSSLSKTKEILKKDVYSLYKKGLVYKDWSSYHHTWYKLTDKGEVISLDVDKLDPTDELYTATRFGKMDKYISEEKLSKKQRLNEYIYFLRKIKEENKCFIFDELNKGTIWSKNDFVNYILPKLYPELFYMMPITTPKCEIYWCNDGFELNETIILFCIEMLNIKNTDKRLKEIYEPKVFNSMYYLSPNCFNTQLKFIN